MSCIIDIYSKYTCFIPLKDKKGITIASAFQKILNESNHKPNKTWVDRGIKFFNRSIKPFLQNNDMEVYLMHNEGKAAIAERLIRNLKKKIINT